MRAVRLTVEHKPVDIRTLTYRTTPPSPCQTASFRPPVNRQLGRRLSSNRRNKNRRNSALQQSETNPPSTTRQRNLELWSSGVRLTRRAAMNVASLALLRCRQLLIELSRNLQHYRRAEVGCDFSYFCATLFLLIMNSSPSSASCARRPRKLCSHLAAVSAAAQAALVSCRATHYQNNKKDQLSLTNPRDACETFARFM